MLLKDAKQSLPKRAPLSVRCPTTQELILTPIDTDVSSLKKAWHSKIKVACPHCGAAHTYKVREAFTNAAISSERLRGLSHTPA
jgi:hypothetical protein